MDSNAKFEDISIEQYSHRSIVVRGDTRKYKEDLKRLGGKYNSRLMGEPGWIFPKTKEGDVNGFIKGGKRIVSKEEADAGEARTREWSAKRDYERTSLTSSKSPSLGGTLAIGEYAILVNMMKDMVRKMERMEQTVYKLLTPEQKEELEEKMGESTKQKSPKQKSPKKVIKRRMCKTKKVETPLTSYSYEEEGEECEEVPQKRLLR